MSLFIVPFGLLGYLTVKFPLMPYDSLTYAIGERFKLKFSTAKITSDITGVLLAGVVCLLGIHSFGSVGIGTIVAAYLVGKILSWMLSFFQGKLQTFLPQKEDFQQSSTQSGVISK